MGELVDKIKGNLDEAAGKIKQQSDNPDTRDEGAAQEIKGKGEQFAGKVKGVLGDDGKRHFLTHSPPCLQGGAGGGCACLRA